MGALAAVDTAPVGAEEVAAGEFRCVAECGAGDGLVVCVFTDLPGHNPTRAEIIAAVHAAHQSLVLLFEDRAVPF